MFANCILFATFCFMGTLVPRKKTWRYSARKIMEFDQLMTDILVYVSCKFEMYICKIAQVISENIRIAFLYVLSICLLSPAFSKKSGGTILLKLSVRPSVRPSVLTSFRPPKVLCTLCAQLLLQFYADSFETLQMFLSWSEDMHVVWILS